MNALDDAGWQPWDWQQRVAAQQPEWPDPEALDAVIKELAQRPALVVAKDVDRLRAALARAARGRAFVLQAGDCAESFHDHSASSLRAKLKIILQMAVVLTYSSGVSVVKIGRIAGQFAKPRSAPVEVVDGATLPSFRGHIVHDDAPTLDARRPNPERLLWAYDQSRATVSVLRALTEGGFADLSGAHRWNLDFVASSPEGQRYQAIADGVDRALRFMAGCGIDLEREAVLHQVNVWTSHEALLLPYEAALTRRDPASQRYYDLSAHMVWVGERTRQLDGAHLRFASGIANPVGLKVGPTMEPDTLVEACRILDPDRTPGRLVLISRMGHDAVRDRLGGLVEAVREAGYPVVWLCDPMHGNTFVSQSGYKTRRFEDVMDEIAGFFEVHRRLGTHAGGIHLELTGEDVTECLGGSEAVLESELCRAYDTICDPRLNARQSLDLAFRVAELLIR
ncbi:phospho-2-dehydro-3-deoxyheptonate aldolase [Acidimicrobium ferrooxidans DSM 10331]|uniref:Phospho-2-dehydro-3-deoxyheptonate aldolase n=1 Tax=Acidimicrobium ferrooxidans (strain DSM 10331 / JCM 15462 / NBRC 103882 / ICP) TaxID=525909 RepID=C7LYD2_ACIFD|nr:3-deoxy-7-phosphoheptulonate synthase class II [Acidimicrobium ferrooxidans]ACU53740.1 phospho-2-dehydro-3-deoxyheptonate aldolase [Acidimicrobium ferrooxidans DSM 10331]